MPINPLQQFMPRVPRPPDPFAAWMRPAYSTAQQQDEIELSPEAEESILARTGRMGLSGVARVGNFLDLPGSSVRDVISSLATGQMQNPLDQWLPWNWTTDANRVSPAQLNEQLGFISPQFRKEHPVWSFGGDMALGIVTDPLTWFGMPGAARLSQAGQVAKRTGMLKNISRALPPELGPRLGAMETSLRPLLQAHGDEMLPLAQAAAKKIGVSLDDVLDQPLVSGRRWLSEGAGKGLAKGLDDLGSFLGKTAPVRGARALFHAPFQGRTPYWEQLVAREQFERMPGARRDVAVQAAKFQEDFNELTTSFREAFGSQFAKEEEIPEAVGQLLRWRGEMQSARKAGTLADQLPPPLAGTFNIPPDQMARFDTLADNVISSLDKVRNHIDEMGGNIGDIDRYFPRFLGDEMKTAMRIYELRGGSRMLPSSFGPGRSKEIAEIPADVVNEMLTYADQTGLTPFRLPKTKGLSPLARKQNLNQASVALETKYHNWLSPKYGLDEADAAKYADMLKNPQNYSPADILQLEAQGRANHAKDLVKWINDHPESAMFTRDPLSDVTQRAMSMAQLEQGREAIHELFRRNAKTFDPTDNLVKLAAETVKTGSKFRSRMGAKFITDPDAIGGNWVTLEDAFKSAGLDPKQAMKYFTNRWNETLGKDGVAYTIDDAARLVVPAELANSAKTFTQTLENPQYQNMVLDGIDWMTRIFKQGVTAHPANWVRNWYSGQYTNITASGEIHSASDLMDYLRFVKESWANRKDPNKLAELIQEGALDPSYLSEGVEHTTKAAQLGANPFNVVESFQGASAAAKAATPVRTLEAILGKPAGSMTGKTGTGALEAAQRTIQTTWGTAMNTSAKASFAVEWMNRAPMYEYLKARGWSPQAAAQKVLELQLDYRHGLAPFEKSVLRRLFPFYSFTRLMAPTVLKALAERPGGAMAHMIRGAARLHGGDALTPEYVSKGLSVPLGETPEGDRRYATASGLPFEDPLSFVGGLRDVGMEGLGRMTPLLKGPAEWFTGRSFFQQGPSGGRALEDMDPVIGRTLRNIEQQATGDTSRRPPPVRTDPFMEAVMSNSPISRYLTTIRTATDPRKTGIEKAVNLLTGARVSTISPAAADAILRERTQVLAKKIGARDFTRTYLPDEVLERLPPHLQQEGQDLKAMLAVLARRAKERAKAAEKP